MTSLSMVLRSPDGAAAGIDPSKEMKVDEMSGKISECVVVDDLER